MSARVFLLSPASCSGNRARLLFSPTSTASMARRLGSEAGVPVGEVFAFISQLYFRGKLAYARTFARAPQDLRLPPPLEAHHDGVFVITTSRGLLHWRTPVTLDTLREFGGVDLRVGNEGYTAPLAATAASIAARLREDDEVVLLGSIASDKYVSVLREIFGARLLFPRDFAGRGDMSRGGLMLRCVDEGRELEYVPLAGHARHGTRPPRLEPRRSSR